MIYGVYRGVPPSNFFLEMAKGKVPGHSIQFRVGYRDGVGTTEEVVCDHGGNHVFLTSAELIDIVSDDDEDTNAGGDGARKLFITGLDDDWAEQSEIVNLAGQTPVQTTLEYLRLDLAFVIDAGNVDAVGGGNAGTITFKSHDTDKVQSEMQPNHVGTLNCIFSVPAGKTAYITVVGMGVGQGKEAIFRAKMRTSQGGPFSLVWKKVMYQNSFWPVFPGPVAVPEKTDVLVTAQGTIATVDVDANLSFYLVDND